MAEDGRAERDQRKRATRSARTAGGPASDPAMAQANARPATRPGWKHTLDPLENRDFRYLWLGMLTLMGGMQMQTLARGYLAYDITSSPLILGVVNAGFALPMLGLSLFGGAVADRVERKRVIQAAQMVEGMAALFIAISIATNTVSWYHLLASSMIHGATFSFMMPARQAIIPQLVGKEMVTNAIALNATAMALMTLVAPAVAGTLYARIGPHGVYFVVAGLGLCAVLFTAMISSTGRVASPSKAPVLDDIVAGLSYVRRSPLVLILLSMGLATALLAMPFRFLMPVFVVDIYGQGPEALGLMVSVMGAGSLVGALLVASLGRWRRGLLLLAASLVTGVGLLLLALVPAYFAAVALMALLGLGDIGHRTLNYALAMEQADDRFRGRVMSLFMMNFGFAPLGVLPAGLIAEFFGGQTAIGVLAVLLLGFTAFIFATQRRLREVQ